MKKHGSMLLKAIVLITLFTTCNKEGIIDLPTVYTLEVIELSPTTALSGGNVKNDGGSKITTRGVVWDTLNNPTFERNVGLIVEGAGTGLFQIMLSGLNHSTIYFVRAFAINSSGTAFGEELSFATKPFVCGTSTVSDVDGNIYNTVLIGNQCWMKENLKTTHYSNRMPIEYPGMNNNMWTHNTTGAYAWSHNDIVWKDGYGALYNWYAVNNPYGLCPSGWHVPSDDEWTQLLDYVVAQGFPNNHSYTNGAANALKSCRQINSPLGGDCDVMEHPRWDEHNTHYGFDEFGFSAFGGDTRGYNGAFGYNCGLFGSWWTTTEYSSTLVRTLTMGYLSGYVDRGALIKSGGLSVRCVRN